MRVGDGDERDLVQEGLLEALHGFEREDGVAVAVDDGDAADGFGERGWKLRALLGGDVLLELADELGTGYRTDGSDDSGGHFGGGADAEDSLDNFGFFGVSWHARHPSFGAAAVLLLAGLNLLDLIDFVVEFFLVKVGDHELGARRGRFGLLEWVHNGCGDHDDQFAGGVVEVLGPEQLAEDRDAADAGDLGERIGDGVVEEAEMTKLSPSRISTSV